MYRIISLIMTEIKLENYLKDNLNSIVKTDNTDSRKITKYIFYINSESDADVYSIKLNAKEIKNGNKFTRELSENLRHSDINIDSTNLSELTHYNQGLWIKKLITENFSNKEISIPSYPPKIKAVDEFLSENIDNAYMSPKYGIGIIIENKLIILNNYQNWKDVCRDIFTQADIVIGPPKSINKHPIESEGWRRIIRNTVKEK